MLSVAAVDACRWTSHSIPHAPYVTSIPWISHYGCFYVGHGDDISSDSSGEDCYRFVKQAGRFKVFKRTPGISTTDLVGRMLLCTKTHFIESLTNVLVGKEGPGSEEERRQRGEEMVGRIADYAMDESAVKRGVVVWSWAADGYAKLGDAEGAGFFSKMIVGKGVRRGQRVVYVDGGFDIFTPGHIEFLRQVTIAEEALADKSGWHRSEAKETRIKESGEDYPPLFLVAGIHDDAVINHWKGVNYPIMNIFERGLCVLQCRVSCLTLTVLIYAKPGSSTSTLSSSPPPSCRPRRTWKLCHMARQLPSTTAQPRSCRHRRILTQPRRRWASSRRLGRTTSST